MVDERGQRAHAEVVGALLDAAPTDATLAFDTALEELVRSGGLAVEAARLLRWRQRDSLRALRDHAVVVLPPVLDALVASARSAPDELKPLPTIAEAARPVDEPDAGSPARPAPPGAARADGPTARTEDPVTHEWRQVRLVAGLRALAGESRT